MSKNLKIAVVLSIIFAIALPLYMVVQTKQAISTARIVKIKIEGYDPRDFLQGNYLMYRYVWNWKGGEPQPKDASSFVVYDKDSCLCIGPGDVDPEVKLLPSCPPAGEKSACGEIVRGSYVGGGGFSPGQNQYYVGETVALPLEGMLRATQPSWENGVEVPGKPLPPERTFRIGLGLLPNGKSIVEKLYIGDEALDDYLAQHYNELTAPSEQTAP